MWVCTTQGSLEEVNQYIGYLSKAELQPENQGIFCEIGSSNNVRRYTHKVSLR